MLESRRLLAASSIVFAGPDGRLVYTPQSDGDRIPDFSMVGYQGGTVPLPDTTGGVSVPVKITLNPGAAGVDQTANIQNAINSVSGMPPDANGFRGAVLLTAGNYPISGQLSITASGVVLMGAGNNATSGTRLQATGTSTRTLINVAGGNSKSTVSGSTHNIQGYVPVGANSFTVDSTANLHVGDKVLMHRPSTTNWLHDIGMDLLTNPWTAGSRDLDWDRVITQISGNTITIDAPITNSLDPNYGGGTIHAFTYSSAPIQQVGVVNFYAYSDYTGSNVPGTPDTDTAHSSGVLSMNNNQNSWIENITADNFATNILTIGSGSKWVTLDHVTIQNVSQAQSNIDDAPSGIGGTMGQLILGENITLTNAYHAISMGGNVPGPNVFTNVTITDPLEGALNLPHSRDETGPHQRYATGGLFDNLSNTDWVNIRNAGNEGSGHGWQGANFVLWNVNARTDVSSPPTAQNWVIGGTGTRNGTGIVDQSGTTVLPTSLYAKQLWDRTHVNPIVAMPATASPNPLGGSTSVSLSVLGAETGLAESSLTYTWSVLSKPSGAADPTFSANGSNAAKSAVATLSQTGTYIFVVTIQDAGGLKTTADVIVTPAAATTISGDQDSINQSDVIRIFRDANLVEVTRNNVLVLQQDYASSPELAINGAGGTDAIIVDYGAGNPIPANGLIVDGGGGSDVVSVIGTSGNDAVALGGGSVSVNGAAGQFSYVGAEELDLSMAAGADTLAASGDASVSAAVFALNVSGGGSVAITSGSTLPSFTDVNVSAGATFDVGGNSQSIDSLSGAGNVIDNGAAATLAVNNGAFSGALTNGSGVLSVTKNSTGKLTLSGNNGYTGNTTINGGVVESGNSASLALLSGPVIFDGGTFHVTADTVSANVANKYTTSFTGAGSSATAVFDIDAGVTLTIGTPGGLACLRTNGGGGHGGDFTKTGAGTLKILSNNGQQDNVFHLNQGTIDLESATGLGGGDAGVRLDATSATTLILKTEVATNFLTPLNIATANGSLTVVLDRPTLGPGVANALNALTSVGAFTLNVLAGPNVNSAIAGLTLGSVTLSGNGLFNILSSGAGVAAVTVSGAVSGAFAVSKSSGGSLILSGDNSYTGATSVNAGTMEVDGSIASSSGVTVASGATFIAGATQTLAGLTINSGGNAQVLAGANKVLTIDALSISGNGALDLADNDLIYDYSGASPLATVQGWIASGYAGGTWAGAGMRSSAAAANAAHSTALGFVEAATLGITSFDGQPVDSTAILVRYTAAADANLDGTVDTLDFNALAAHFGATGQTWTSADFNYDGVVDTLDFNALASKFGAALPAGGGAAQASALPLAAPSAAVRGKVFSADSIRDGRLLVLPTDAE